MKKRNILMMALASAVLLTGCNNGDKAAEWVPPAKEEETQEVDLEREITYVKDGFSQDNYLKLAEHYAELGLVRMQRDTLEQGYRLFDDAEFLEKLQGLYVNLEEEDEKIAGEAATMYQNLELPEYLAESIHLAEENDWFATMMPKLSEGSRNYFQTQDGVTKFTLTVGYDENGVPYTHAWFYPSENEVRYMSYSNQLAQIMETTIDSGNYNGEFTLWTMNGSNGNITQETGVFENGVASDNNYMVKLHQGSAPGDIYDLWNNKEGMNYITLFGDDVAARSRLGEVAANPSYAVYEAADTRKLEQDNPQVRIYDGQIQYLSDKGWIDLGSAEAYAAADPFVAYAEAKAAADAQTPAAREEEPQITGTANLAGAGNGTANANGDDRTNGNNSQTTNNSTNNSNNSNNTNNANNTGNTNNNTNGNTNNTNNTTNRNNNTTNRTTTANSTQTTTNTTPAVTEPTPAPAPTPAPTPAPVEEDDDDDDDDDGGSSAPADSGNDGGGDSGNDGGNDGGDSGDDSGNDADIEWTPDNL